ncbi:MAG: XisI protein [Spirosomaceae bacterium]|nr:XisI protein [Spirosomataceae bacterium]
MDKKIKKYRHIIQSFLQQEVKDRTIEGIDFQVIIDKNNGHFQMVETGWYDKTYIYSVIFHFQIKSSAKVWILANNSDILVAEELVKRGILASDIVIGFHPVNVRQFTGFAVA